MKNNHVRSLLILPLLCASMTACGDKSVTVTELSFYQGQNKDSDGNAIYNENLFYTNETQYGGPDPFVLDDTARSGYYYVYYTDNTLGAYRSKDLFHWEGAGNVFIRGDMTEEERNSVNSNLWASEVIYDEESKLYYMFFSASPKKAEITGHGVVQEYSNEYNMYVATSSSPTGPFKLVDFTDKSVMGENVHTFNTKTDIELTKEQVDSGDYAYTEESGTYYLAAYPQYYAKYCLFSPDIFSKVIRKNGTLVNETATAKYFFTIDPSPYVDPDTGKKYLYFKIEAYNNAQNIMIGVEMENWLTPKWETAKYLGVNSYYTVEDWKKSLAGEEVDHVSYEQTTTTEGPFMIKHGNKYYLTYSFNDYGTSAYSVATMVSDSPLGDFRKLREEEGGLLLCSSYLESKTISGAGHHSFMEKDGKLYIIYHRHRNFNAGGGDRYTAIDEIKWIDVKDIDGNNLTIPYTNGPTDSIQPLPEYISGYRNVAEEATVTSDNPDCNPSYTNDGLLSVYKTADETFMSYIKETKIQKETTFTYTFDNPVDVRSVLVYNSAYESDTFRKITKIELAIVDGDKTVTKEMKDIQFDFEENGLLYDGNVDYVKSGAFAYAEFYDQKVTSVKVTMDIPEGQEQVGISEIRILGK